MRTRWPYMDGVTGMTQVRLPKQSASKLQRTVVVASEANVCSVFKHSPCMTFVSPRDIFWKQDSMTFVELPNGKSLANAQQEVSLCAVLASIRAQNPCAGVVAKSRFQNSLQSSVPCERGVSSSWNMRAPGLRCGASGELAWMFTTLTPSDSICHPKWHQIHRGAILFSILQIPNNTTLCQIPAQTTCNFCHTFSMSKSDSAMDINAPG